MMKTTKRLTGIFLATLLFIMAIPTFEVEAAGRSDVTVSDSVFGKYLVTKTIDLSESDIDIVVTKAEDEALYKSAKESALLWVYYTELLQGEVGSSEDQVAKYGLWDMYWWEKLNLNPDDLELEEGVKESLDTIASYSDIDALISAVQKGAVSLKFIDDSSENPADVLKGKVEEIYNDKFSDFITPAIAQALPVVTTFKFYDADGNEIASSDVDFGKENQFYDKVLADGIYSHVSSARGAGEPVFAYPEARIRDNRTVSYHILVIDNGTLMSSDESQIGYMGKRGDKDDNYPGEHGLLEIFDPLATYSWARYGIPYYDTYTKTFNLHLNPAVTYTYDIKDKNGNTGVDLITDIEFDGNGRVLSVTKPIEIPEKVWNMLSEGNKVTMKETGISGELFGSNALIMDPNEYDLEVTFADPEYEWLPKIWFDMTEAHAVNKAVDLIDIEVTKGWDDQDDKDKIRPKSVDVKLTAEGLEDQEVAGVTDYPTTVTLSEDNNWTYKWEKLDSRKTYSVEEVKTDVITGTDSEKTYAITVDGNQDSGFVITNTHTPKKPEEPDEPTPEEPDEPTPDEPTPEERTLKISTMVEAGGKTASETQAAVLTCKEAEAVDQVVDTIYYSGMLEGKTYTVEGKLVRIDVDGKQTVCKEATEDMVADGKEGEWTLTFDGVELINYAKYVVFEKVYSAEDELATKKEPLVHENPNDLAQTILTEDQEGVVLGEKEKPKYDGKLDTTVEAGSKKGTDKEPLKLTNEEAATIKLVKDTVKYSGLKGGDKYTITGTLTKVVDGQAVEKVSVVSKEFTADASGSGTLNMEFDNVKLDGDSMYVVFEMTENEHPNKKEDVTDHSDVKDKSQTIEIKKKAESTQVTRTTSSSPTTTTRTTGVATGDNSGIAIWIVAALVALVTILRRRA